MCLLQNLWLNMEDHTLCNFMIHTLHSRIWHRPAELLLELKSYIVLIEILVVSQSFLYVLWLKAGQQLDPLPQISLWRVKQMNKCLWAPTRQRKMVTLSRKMKLPVPCWNPVACLCLVVGADIDQWAVPFSVLSVALQTLTLSTAGWRNASSTWCYLD